MNNQTKDIPFYVLEYKNKILPLLVYLPDDWEFFKNIEPHFDHFVQECFYSQFIRLLTGENYNGGIVKSDYNPVLPNDYDTIIVTFVKQYKYTTKTVVIGYSEDKIKYYNNIENSNSYMKNLNVIKKLKVTMLKSKDNIYRFAYSDEIDIDEIKDKHLIWPQ